MFHFLTSVINRLMITDTFTPQMRDLWNCLDEAKEWAAGNNDNCANEKEMVERLGVLFQGALAGLAQVIARHKAGQETYLHIPYFLNEPGVASKADIHPLARHPIYENVYNHYVVGSNLGADEGIQFVFSGIPPIQSDMNVIGYMLLDDRIAFTFTSRLPLDKEKLLSCMTSALSLVTSLAEIPMLTQEHILTHWHTITKHLRAL